MHHFCQVWARIVQAFQATVNRQTFFFSKIAKYQRFLQIWVKVFFATSGNHFIDTRKHPGKWQPRFEIIIDKTVYQDRTVYPSCPSDHVSYSQTSFLTKKGEHALLLSL